MASSFSSATVYLCLSISLLSGLLLFELTTCRQSTPLADPHEAWVSSTDLTALAQPVALINVENVVEGIDNRDPKGDKVLLRDNRGATHGKLYLRGLIQLGLMDPPF